MTLSGVENTDKFFHLVSQPQASYEALDAGQGGATNSMWIFGGS